MTAVKEWVVISGKGGTGKTSVAASLAVLAGNAVIADCDVDAADLHLILKPEIRERHDFFSGREAVIRKADCSLCGTCADLCRFEAVRRGRDGDKAAFFIDPVACEGCGVCARFCPSRAVDMQERLCGEWMVSDTRCGILVHARLGIAAENSGKLVSKVRKEARRIAEEKGGGLLIVDGPPGIGCPAIAAIGGASAVVAVTEPTVSGEHDLERVLSLARHFRVPVAVCLNKWDINSDAADRIEERARQAGAKIAGRIRYDPAVTLAQMRERAAAETDAPAAEDIRNVWHELQLVL